MLVKVTIGVQVPDLVDVERVRAELPRGAPRCRLSKVASMPTMQKMTMFR